MKYSPETVKTICDHILIGLSQKDAALMAGISESVFYLWKSQAEAGDPEKLEFLESLKKAEAQLKASSLMEITKQGKENKSWQAIAWILERKFPKEFGRWDRTSLEIVDNATLSETDEYTKEELSELWAIDKARRNREKTPA